MLKEKDAGLYINKKKKNRKRKRKEK